MNISSPAAKLAAILLVMGLPAAANLTLLPAEAQSLDASEEIAENESLNDVSVSTSPEYDEYLGMIYVSGSIETIPGNLTDFGGWIVSDSGPNSSLDYAIGNIVDEATGNQLVFFEKEVGRALMSNRNRAIWEVLDVMNVTAESTPVVSSEAGETQIFLNAFCQSEGQHDPELFAITDSREDIEFFPALQVWRANRSTGEIEPVSAAGIECVNMGWGL